MPRSPRKGSLGWREGQMAPREGGHFTDLAHAASVRSCQWPRQPVSGPPRSSPSRRDTMGRCPQLVSRTRAGDLHLMR
jgi:hypothetical protein